MSGEERARFEAWNDTLPFHLDTSPYEYARLAYQAATDALSLSTTDKDTIRPTSNYRNAAGSVSARLCVY